MRVFPLLLGALLAGWTAAAAAEPAADYGEELPIVRVPEVKGGAMAVQLVGQTLYVLGCRDRSPLRSSSCSRFISAGASGICTTRSSCFSG